ncbi:MAG: DinB family protein [Flavobacteriales bacterium]|nr:DinB family protein [Flavobacteriales bacterium]
MSNSFFQQLLKHEHWASVHVADALLSLDTIPEKAKTIFDHLIAAHENWYARTQSTAPSLEISLSDIPVSSYKALLDEYQIKWMTLLEEPDALEKRVTYKNTKGQEFTNPVSEILTHLCLHQQYHRGQVLTLIRPLVEVVPATDFIAFLRL